MGFNSAFNGLKLQFLPHRERVRVYYKDHPVAYVRDIVAITGIVRTIRSMWNDMLVGQSWFHSKSFNIWRLSN